MKSSEDYILSAREAIREKILEISSQIIEHQAIRNYLAQGVLDEQVEINSLREKKACLEAKDKAFAEGV